MSARVNVHNWPDEKIEFFENHNIRAVRPVRIAQSRLDRKVAFFEKHNIHYWLEQTRGRNTVYAAGPWGTWMNKDKAFEPSELQFIKKVKQHVLENETYKLVKNIFKKEGSENKIKYFYYNKNIKPGTVYNDLIEVDLKGAYWEQLYMLPGVITREIYEEGLKVEKKTRLAAVGTMAKTTNVIKYDGKASLGDPIKSNLTSFLWNTISYKIGKVMAKAMRTSKSDFIFFWVDAIFIHGHSKDEVIKIFKEAGFNCSVVKCEWVRFDKTKIIVHSKEKGKHLKKRTREKITLPNGKPAVKIVTKNVWTEDRPFPYKKALSVADIEKLSNG